MHRKVFFVDVLVLLALVVFLLASLLLEAFIDKKEIPEKSIYKLRCAECGKYFGYIYGALNGDDNYIFRIQTKDTGFTYELFCSEECCKAYYEKFKI